MHLFGKALFEKAVELQLPSDHKYLRWIKDYPLPIKGCTDEEIKVMAHIQQVKKLPRIYIDFMKYFGKASGDLFIGYSFYHTEANMKDIANKYLRNEGKFQLNSNDFVFMDLNGHSFWYFDTSSGEDPAIYMYVISDGDDEDDYPFKLGGIKIEENLSIFLTQFIAERESEEKQSEFLRKYVKLYQQE